MTERTTIRPESGHGLERVIFFSDAVIAIALTLLALELQVPHAYDAPDGEKISLLHDFQEKMGKEYMAFLISFAVIAVLWFNHHRLFQQVAKLSYGMIWLNLAGLFAIVLMPFATKVLTELGDIPAGPIFYAGDMVLWGVVWTLMAVIANRQRLWRADSPKTAFGNMLFGAGALLFGFGLSIPISFIDPTWAMYFWISAFPISFFGMRIRRNRQARAEATAA